MPVIALKEVESMSPQMQELVKVFDEWVGDTVFARVMAHCPEMFLKFNDFYDSTLNGGTVESEIKELARLRLARRNDCDY